GSALEFDLLFVEGMGSMVGSDGIDGAVGDAGDHGVAVGGGAQRRGHLVVGVELADVFVDQREVMRRDFSGGMDAGLLGLADSVHGFGGGDVGDMNMRLGRAGQRNITSDNVSLGGVSHAAQAQAERHGPLVHGASGSETRVLG